jgi:hypothetical protein
LTLKRYLKKVVLPEMMTRGEVEKVHVAQGKLNNLGQRMDAITSKGYDKTMELNVARQKDEWRWRLIPEDKIEHHKDVVAKLSPKLTTRKIRPDPRSRAHSRRS